jgi:hypothetical protein
MRVLFLDIDGVLNSEWSITKLGKDCKFNDNPHPLHIKWLNHIVAKTGAKVVISSVWRRNASWLQMWRLLDALGFEGEVIGETPELHSHRGVEIQTWLNVYKDGKALLRFSEDKPPEPIESFVILDDDSDMGDLRPYLIKVDAKKGLTKEDAGEAIKVLNMRDIPDKFEEDLC